MSFTNPSIVGKVKGLLLFTINLKKTLWEDDGWFRQPHLAQSGRTLGLGEAADLLHIE